MEKKYVLKKDYPFAPYYKKGAKVKIMGKEDTAFEETAIYIMSDTLQSGTFIGMKGDAHFNFHEWIEEVREPIDGWVALKADTNLPWIRSTYISLTKEDCLKEIEDKFKGDYIPIHIKEVQE